MTRRPFLVSYESFLPRFPDDHEHGALMRPPLGWLEERLRASLASDRCVACLAFSEYARRQFRKQAASSPHRAAIEAKLRVRYPVMPLRRTTPKPGSGELKLLFVAHRFMGKGGPALLRAHERLRAAGVPVTTTVVSALAWEPDDYIGPGSRALVEREHQRVAGPGVVHLPSAAQRARAGVDGGGRLLRPADVPRHVRLRRARVARRRDARDRLGHVRAARGRRARRERLPDPVRERRRGRALAVDLPAAAIRSTTRPTKRRSRAWPTA